jgi:recombination protein RecT
MEPTTTLAPQGKTLTPAQKNIVDFKNKLNGNYVQTQLKQVLKENSGTFATSLMEVFTGDKSLQTCDPNLVIQEAMKAASLKLPLNKQLGYGYIVVYNVWDKSAQRAIPTPTFIPGYRGYIQLAMRTGQYRTINADIVYDGELRSKDKLTGAIDLKGEAISDRVIGYFAHFELLNGFSKTLYMTKEQMANFALKYAAAFKARKGFTPPTLDQLIDMAQTQASNGPGQGVGWNGDYNAMATKTVLRHLLSKWGYLSIEMMNAFTMDEKEELNAEAVRDEENGEARPVIDASKILARTAEDAQAEEVRDEQDKPDF